jgi:hypothetical protein
MLDQERSRRKSIQERVKAENSGKFILLGPFKDLRLPDSYEVHEKMQNFMVPIPTIVDGWHEEKIDELFASLLGKSSAEVDKRQVPHPTAALVKDGFRVFG